MGEGLGRLHTEAPPRLRTARKPRPPRPPRPRGSPEPVKRGSFGLTGGPSESPRLLTPGAPDCQESWLPGLLDVGAPYVPCNSYGSWENGVCVCDVSVYLTK